MAIIKNKLSKVAVLIIGIITLLSVCLIGFDAAKSNRALAQNDAAPTATDILSYNENDFIVTEDFSAFVDPAMHNGDTIVKLDDSEKMKIQLDRGKSGLLVSSVATGNDVEGKSFGVKNVLKGNFNLDFRVFSQKTFYGFSGAAARAGFVNGYSENNGTILDDRYNPFMDIRTVGIKITSAADREKAFTVYIHGCEPYQNSLTSARVYIENETYRDAGRHGYGLSDGKYAPGGYGYATQLKSTSFCNITTVRETFANSISFDLDEMSVYGKSYNLENRSSGRGSVYTEENRLIRNVSTNSNLKTNKGEPVTLMGVKTLSKSDFEGGYYVDVIIDSMTSDDTPLTTTVYEKDYDSDPVYGKSAKSTVVSGFENGYARTANIVLYNINGQDLKKYEGWDAQTFSNGTDSAEAAGGVQLTSAASGTAAEGNGFSLSTESDSPFIKDSKFEITYTALSQNYAENAGATGYEHYKGKGLGKNIREIDPYSDVKETAITFRSKTDSTKAFTVYVASRDIPNDQPVARVGVEGESYRDSSGYKGFGGNPNSWAEYHVKLDGSFGTYNSDASASKYVSLQFDPATMTVLGKQGGNWTTIRNLTKSDAVNTDIQFAIKTLSAADFAGGYTVDFEVLGVNAKDNRGLDKIYYLENLTPTQKATGFTSASADGYIFNGNLQRDVKLRIAGATVAAIGAKLDTAYYNDSGAKWIDFNCGAAVSYTKEINLTANVTSLFTSEKLSNPIAYAHATLDDSGEVAYGEKFSPKHLGEYTLTCGGYTQSVQIIDDIAPDTEFASDIKNIVRLGESFSISKDDIVTSDYWGGDVTVKIECNFNGREIDIENASTEKLGIFQIVYTATDARGNFIKLPRDVLVLTADKIAPIIFWNNRVSQSLVSSSIDLSQITALDETDGTISVSIEKVVLSNGGEETELTIENKTVSADKTGELYIYVSATDSGGNKTEKVYRIEVLTELKPVISASDYDGGTGDENTSPAKNYWWVWLVSFGGAAIVGGAVVAAVIVLKRKNGKQKN